MVGKLRTYPLAGKNWLRLLCFFFSWNQFSMAAQKGLKGEAWSSPRSSSSVGLFDESNHPCWRWWEKRSILIGVLTLSWFTCSDHRHRFRPVFCTWKEMWDTLSSSGEMLWIKGGTQWALGRDTHTPASCWDYQGWCNLTTPLWKIIKENKIKNGVVKFLITWIDMILRCPLHDW